MILLNIFDLHCDTVSTCIAKHKDLLDNDLHLSIKRGIVFDKWVQAFAFWIPDTLRGELAYNNFLMQYNFINQYINDNSDIIKLYDCNDQLDSNCCYAILAIEGGAALAGSIDKLYNIITKNIKIITLCWNDDNEIAGGVYGTKRLTDFGKQAVRKMEEHKVIVDVSHLNKQSFWDVCNFATRPFIASHSNCNSVYQHKRNLDDDQIKEIVQMNGLIGINFYTDFVCDNKNYTVDDLIYHIDKLLELGAQDIICLGSDFDGADMPDCLNQIEKLHDLERAISRQFGEKLKNKILFENANRFFIKNLK